MQACHTQAVQADDWREIGTISDLPTTRNRKPGSYKAFETTITLYGKPYRGIVVHSDAHDKRRQKKVDKQIKQDLDGPLFTKSPSAKAATSKHCPGHDEQERSSHP